MLETLTKGFRTARQRLTGEAELTEADIDEALKEVRLSLLEADVEFRVVKHFLGKVKENLLGEKVRLQAKGKAKKAKITVGDYFVKASLDELTSLMGEEDSSLNFSKKGPTGIMMAGLQGSGKTTTVGKLASYLVRRHGRKPLLVAADVYRPAAIEQLKVLGQRIDVPVYYDDSGDPPGIAERAFKEAMTRGRDTVIIDTAGRLAIDEPLMQELEEIKRRVRPSNTLLVVDAMMGQDAVRTAKTFNERIELSGVILTKLDGDTRGGAALSVRHVTGKPIKFLGMGEDLDRLEEFRPEGLASRILGMGDVVGLMKDFEEVVDEEKAEEDAARMLKGRFNMADFLEQIRTIQKMGSLKDLVEKLPFFKDGLPDGVQIDDRELTKIESIISSMTRAERERPELFVVTSFEEIKDHKGRKKGRKAMSDYDLDRVRRVARGSGRKESDVKDLLYKFATMRGMMMELGQSQGLLGKIPGLKQWNRMRKLAGMNMDQIMDGMKDLMPAGPGLPPGGLPGAAGFRPPARSVDRSKLKKKRKEARKARKANKRKK
ncbi:MAG: signal recognition particle protein [Polyangia bacterium]|jgi:signal recognition particle subunit SRP54|nr:signal recognition particle protein [Polyangia bacterium]